MLHAAWTLLLARAPDSDAATAAALAIAVVVFAPFAALTWDVEAAAWPYIALSAVFELGFFATLAVALRSGEVGVVYPLSRGAAPVLVLVVGVVALGHDATAAQAIGIGVDRRRGAARAAARRPRERPRQPATRSPAAASSRATR